MTRKSFMAALLAIPGAWFGWRKLQSLGGFIWLKRTARPRYSIPETPKLTQAVLDDVARTMNATEPVRYYFNSNGRCYERWDGNSYDGLIEPNQDWITPKA